MWRWSFLKHTYCKYCKQWYLYVGWIHGEINMCQDRYLIISRIYSTSYYFFYDLIFFFFLKCKRYDLCVEKRKTITDYLNFYKNLWQTKRMYSKYFVLKHFFLHLQFVYDKDMISKDFLGKVILTLDKLKEISHKVGK